MTINPMGSNRTEVEQNGHTLFFSYKTLVAMNHRDGGFYRTATKYSVTTSKHINQWLDGRNAKTVEQSELERMAEQ